HKVEASQLLKYSYRVSSKALNPSNLERQNVKLSLQVFMSFWPRSYRCSPTSVSISACGRNCQFHQVIFDWWKIVNVKKKKHARDSIHCDVYEKLIS
ncbi:hypothetical protein HPB47_017309, partial [Ixodes persulcatus]